MTTTEQIQTLIEMHENWRKAMLAVIRSPSTPEVVAARLVHADLFPPVVLDLALSDARRLEAEAANVKPKDEPKGEIK
jgi:hypothetical protein